MVSDILQNKTYSHSYYIVANIWHLLIVPKSPFFPFSWHTHHSSKPHRVSFSPPTGAQTQRDRRIQARLGICLESGLLLAGKQYLKGYYCWIYYNRVGCVRFYAGFLLWPRCWPKFHFGSHINNCWVQPANIFWWSNFLPTLECLSKLYMKCRNLG